MGAPLYSFAGRRWTDGGATAGTSIENAWAVGPSLLTSASCNNNINKNRKI